MGSGRNVEHRRGGHSIDENQHRAAAPGELRDRRLEVGAEQCLFDEDEGRVLGLRACECFGDVRDHCEEFELSPVREGSGDSIPEFGLGRADDHAGPARGVFFRGWRRRRHERG
jgi:hypothetical protein